MMPGSLRVPGGGEGPAGMSGAMFGGMSRGIEGNGFAHPSNLDAAEMPAGINVEEAR